MADRYRDTVARSSGDGVFVLVLLRDAQRTVQAERMRRPALVMVRGDDPNLLGQFLCNLGQRPKPGSIEPIVVRKQHL